MKTKNLMTAFALSAIFAACSQDAELNEAIAKNDFSNIPMVEAEFTATTGVESRLASKRGWEVNDIIGFAYLSDGNILLWDGTAYGNHPLYCTDATAKTFKGETMYYEGTYFSYLPYDENLKKLGYVSFNVEGQTLSTSLDDYAKKMIYISPNVVTLEDDKDAEYKAGRGNNIALKLLPFNNAAIVDLNFKNIENLANLKITKVEISVKNDQGSDILPMNFKYAPSENVVAIQPAFTDWANVPVEDFFTNATNNFTSGDYGTLTLTSEEGLAVTNNALSTYALLLPVSGNHGTPASLNITVTTNYGTMTAVAKVKAKAADQYADVSATTPLFTKFNQTGYITAEFDGETISLGNEATVTSQAELNDVLNKLVAIEEDGIYTITLNHAVASNPAKPFVLTDFTMPEGLKAQYIALKAGGKTNGKIEFAGNTIVNYPLALGANATVTGSMTVEYVEDVAWTLTNYDANRALEIGHGAVLNNNGIIAGSLAVSTVAATTGTNAKAAGKYIHAGEKAALASTLANNGEAEWLLGASEVPAKSGNPFYAVVNSYASLKAAGAAKVPVARIMGDYYFDNANTNIVVPFISIIECYGNVTFGIEANSINGASTVEFPSLQTINVNEAASLSIYSSMWIDDEVNTFAWSVAGVAVKVAKNANFSLSNIKIVSDANVNNEGTVNVYNVLDNDVNKNPNKGSWTSKEVK